MMSEPRRPARAGFGIARYIATRMPAAMSLRTVELGRVRVIANVVLSFTSRSFRMGKRGTFSLRCSRARCIAQAFSQYRGLRAHGRDIGRVRQTIEINL